MQRKLNISEQINILEQEFLKAADNSKAVGMKAYMKNMFPFLGIQKPARDEITKKWFSDMGNLSWKEQLDVSNRLWKKEQREFQYVAMQLLFKNKKTWTEESIDYFEKLVLSKSWWDTVDFIAANLIGTYFEKFPQEKKKRIRIWKRSENMWLNRSAILFQLKYKSKTDEALLVETINPHLSSGEFFIQKAIGWALRQYAYTSPAFVLNFVKENKLKALSKREALKHFGTGT